MRFLNKMVSFIAVAACTSAAFAATSRVSMITTAGSRRMPTISKNVVASTTTATTATTSSTSDLLDNVECLDAYGECIKASDVCGPNFEECTTRVLFHAQMPKCVSTLAQCSSAGISSLFGTTSTTSLATGATKNEYGEITDYTYPTDSSVLGQLITAGAISNKYDTATCVKRYTNCLKKDSVCGDDFALCTTNNEFKKQKVLCESTLARCQSDAKIELFGSNTTSAAPKADSRLGQMITEGASLAAMNSVSTCYKVVDQCILGACAANPYKCHENANVAVVNAADEVNTGTVVAADAMASTETLSKSAVSSYLQSACMDTIGANKYCYATFLGNGLMPTASQAADADNQEEIFDEAYNARINTALKTKITELVNNFDAKAKEKCAATIKSCAMRACGGGIGAVCYSQVFGASGDKSINGAATYEDVKTGCMDVVNTDPNCKYAAANPGAAGSYSYTYIQKDAFATLFPEYDEGNEADPVGAVSALNATLATAYSDAAIAQMRKQCQSVASSCVRTLCGADYKNCYRNRTDVFSNLTNTGDGAFDKSMNKVGGVLDYTIVLGLCLDTVKNADVCSEHLAIEQQKYKPVGGTDSWGGASSVRGGWIDAGSATKIERTTMESDIQMTDENGNELCTVKDSTDQGVCYTMNAEGMVYDQPLYMSTTAYVQKQAAESLFKDLIFDLEKEAQAKYNAKLTQEQNACFAMNNGGILGKSDTGSTYMWVKMRGKIPGDYSINGLTTKNFVASNDLYGSFCRVRITLMSDDKDIQAILSKSENQQYNTAYFAVGDTFTCGSWLPNSVLTELSEEIGCKRAGGNWDDGKCSVSDSDKKKRAWTTAAVALAGTVGGFFAGDAIADATGLGGLVVGSKGQKNGETCEKQAESAIKALGEITNTKESSENKKGFLTSSAKSAYADVISPARLAATAAKKAKMDTASDALSAVTKLDTALTNYGDRYNEWSRAEAKDKDDAATNVQDAADDVVNAASTLKSRLQTLQSECSGGDDKKSLGGSLGVSLGTAAVLGTAGGLITGFAMKDAQESKLSEAQKAEIDAWMEEIGNHLQCYVGSDENVMTYGTTAAITLDQ